MRKDLGDCDDLDARESTATGARTLNARAAKSCRPCSTLRKNVNKMVAQSLHHRGARIMAEQGHKHTRHGRNDAGNDEAAAWRDETKAMTLRTPRKPRGKTGRA